MKKFYVGLSVLVAITILFSSCASILNGKQQEVTVRLGDPDAKLYVDNEYRGSGRTVTTELKRDAMVRQIKVEREGHKPAYAVFYQRKKSPLYILSVIPFGILLYPLFYDQGVKAYNYDKELSAPEPIEINERKENERYIYLQNTSFDVKKEDLSIQRLNRKRYEKNKRSYSEETLDEDLEVDNTIFSRALNSTLKDYGYIDTVGSIFKTSNNTLKVSATVTEITFKEVYTLYSPYSSATIYPYFIVADMKIDWEIQDVYGQKQYSATTTESSGEISGNFYEDGGLIEKAFEDGIANSFFELMSKSEVKKILKMKKIDREKMQLITLNRPVKRANNLTQAQAATVTIKNGDGSHGSGCVINEDGYIITNYHVIAQNKEDCKVRLSTGEEVEAKFIRGNESADLALLKIDKRVDYAYSLPVNENYKLGQDVYAIGTPETIELGQTLTRGIISGVRKQDDFEIIQTDVTINPGNSGGALVNKSGELLGIVSSKMIGYSTEGIGFCIPARKVAAFLDISYQ